MKFKLDGWKSVIGYVLLSIPGVTDYPMLADAIQKIIENPSGQNVVNVLVHAVLGIGILDRIRKNLKL